MADVFTIFVGIAFLCGLVYMIYRWGYREGIEDAEKRLKEDND